MDLCIGIVCKGSFSFKSLRVNISHLSWQRHTSFFSLTSLPITSAAMNVSSKTISIHNKGGCEMRLERLLSPPCGNLIRLYEPEYWLLWRAGSFGWPKFHSGTVIAKDMRGITVWIVIGLNDRALLFRRCLLCVGAEYLLYSNSLSRNLFEH